MELRIDLEFQSKIPPLTEAEFNQLEENIIEDQEVLVPLDVWNGVIVDGHNRWKIILKHPGIPYKVKERHFSDKWEAFAWMYKNQLGRRNLTEEQTKYLRGKMYEARKHATVGNPNKRNADGTFHCTQNGDNGTTRVSEQIAKELGIGKGTVLRSYEYSRGIDAIKEQEPEIADSILKAERKIPMMDIEKIGKSAQEERPEMIQAVKEGRKVQTVQPKVEKPKMTDEEKQKRKEEIEQINEIRDRLFQQETKAEYTIESLLTDIENNARPYINLFRQMIERNKELCKTNKQVVINAIQDNVIAEMNDLVKEIEGYE